MTLTRRNLLRGALAAVAAPQLGPRASAQQRAAAESGAAILFVHGNGDHAALCSGNVPESGRSPLPSGRMRQIELSHK